MRPPPRRQVNCWHNLLFAFVLSTFFFKQFKITAKLYNFSCGHLFFIKFACFLDYSVHNLKTKCVLNIQENFVFFISCRNCEDTLSNLDWLLWTSSYSSAKTFVPLKKLRLPETKQPVFNLHLFTDWNRRLMETFYKKIMQKHSEVKSFLYQLQNKIFV